MTTVNPTIPDELANIVYSNEFEWDGGFTIESVKFSSGKIQIVFITYYVEPWEDDHPYSITGRWSLEISSIGNHSIQYGGSNEFQYYDSHPLLLEYHEPEASLFFSSAPNNKELLVNDLYTIHHEVCKGLIPVEQFLNRDDLVTQCNSKFGLFAEGPLSLIKKYKAVLDNHNIINNILEKDISNELDKEPPHYMLLTLGDSYFIAKDFVFKKIG